VKITDVAMAAGVAPMTVSRVLNTPDRVSTDTRTRVQAAIERLGYVPNLIAGGLSSRRSRMIAAIVPTIASPMFSVPVQSFTDALAHSGYRVMLALSGYADGTEDELIRAVLSRRPDGLLLTGAVRTQSVQRLLHEAGIPVVEIWDNAAAPTDMLVGFDHAEVGAAVAEFFLEAGHTRFAAMLASDPRAHARRTGFVQRLAKAGHALIELPIGGAPSGIADGRAGMRALIPRLEGRTAVFCSSDLVAFGAITEARIQNIAVPEMVAICGFGDFELSRQSDPPATTVSVDGTEMGRSAAAHLLARLRGEHPEKRHIVPFRIVPRSTT
jgi:LacI family gluconate utilization system Gnt-I transcriptional repressor